MPVTQIHDEDDNRVVVNQDGSINTKSGLQVGGANISDANPVPTKLVGSLAKLSTDPLPEGQEGWTLLSYDVATKVTTVYKYISGDWREL